MPDIDPEAKARITSMVDTLKWHRNHRGWTQRQVGDLLHVDQTTVAHLESGKQIPNLARLIAWSALFDLNVGLFATEDEEDEGEEDFDDLDELEDLVDAIVRPAPPYQARFAA